MTRVPTKGIDMLMYPPRRSSKLIFYLLAACAFLAGGAIPLEGAAKYRSVLIEHVPHVKQKPDFCGEACCAMYLAKLGKKVRLASEQDMGSAFPDCEVGAEPPFGSIYKMSTLVDESLGEQGQIVFRAGSHEKTIKMSYQDYARIEAPAVASFAVGA